MHIAIIVARLCRPLRPLLIASVLAGCACGALGPPQPHDLQLNADAPHGNTATVCSAYGCPIKRPSPSPTTLSTVMASDHSHTAADERKTNAKAIAWIEYGVGRKTGTWQDRAGIEFSTAGHPSQTDCVDETMNT